MAPAAALRGRNPNMFYERVPYMPRATAGFPLVVVRADDDVDGKVKEIIAEQLGVDLDKITGDATFTDLGADSLDTVELLMALEENFGVEIPEEEALKLTNVQAVIDYAKAKR